MAKSALLYTVARRSGAVDEHERVAMLLGSMTVLLKL